MAAKRFYVPASEHIFGVLRDRFRSAIPNDADFEDVFDRFEYLLALGYVRGRMNKDLASWGPIGRFGYRNRYSGQHISNVLNEERVREGKDWAPVAEELFEDEEYQKADAALREQLKQVNFL